MLIIGRYNSVRNDLLHLIDKKDHRMKKIAATFLLTGILAVAGFAAPAMAASDKNPKVSVEQTSGWWPN
jgi:hypothetical protein